MDKMEKGPGQPVVVRARGHRHTYLRDPALDDLAHLIDRAEDDIHWLRDRHDKAIGLGTTVIITTVTVTVTIALTMFSLMTTIVATLDSNAAHRTDDPSGQETAQLTEFLLSLSRRFIIFVGVPGALIGCGLVAVGLHANRLCDRLTSVRRHYRQRLRGAPGPVTGCSRCTGPVTDAV